MSEPRTRPCTDSEALLDVMGRLRQVYPNTLQVRNIGRREREQSPQGSRDMLRQGHLELFDAFFRDIQDEVMTEEQRVFLKDLQDSMPEGKGE